MRSSPQVMSRHGVSLACEKCLRAEGDTGAVLLTDLG